MLQLGLNKNKREGYCCNRMYNLENQRRFSERLTHVNHITLNGNNDVTIQGWSVDSNVNTWFNIRFRNKVGVHFLPIFLEKVHSQGRVELSRNKKHVCVLVCVCGLYLSYPDLLFFLITAISCFNLIYPVTWFQMNIWRKWFAI